MINEEQIIAKMAAVPRTCKHKNRLMIEVASALGIELTGQTWQAIADERKRQDAIRRIRFEAWLKKEYYAMPFRERNREAYQRVIRRRVRRQIDRENHGPQRRAIQRELRLAGYRLEHSDGGSNYYVKMIGDYKDTVRISDHEVPITPERNWNEIHGRAGWAYRDYLNPLKYDTVEEARKAARQFAVYAVGECGTDGEDPLWVRKVS